MNRRVKIDLPHGRIAEFCQRWKICELALFGSVLREDFSPDSDVDVLVSFTPKAEWGLSRLLDMKEELERLLGRRVDLVERRLVEQSENPFRKQHILNHLEQVYVA